MNCPKCGAAEHLPRQSCGCIFRLLALIAAVEATKPDTGNMVERGAN